MTNYERDHLSPPNEREPKYTKCENCDEGFVYEETELGLEKEQCQHPGCVDGWIEC